MSYKTRNDAHRHVHISQGRCKMESVPTYLASRPRADRGLRVNTGRLRLQVRIQNPMNPSSVQCLRTQIAIIQPCYAPLRIRFEQLLTSSEQRRLLSLISVTRRRRFVREAHLLEDNLPSVHGVRGLAVQRDAVHNGWARPQVSNQSAVVRREEAFT